MHAPFKPDGRCALWKSDFSAETADPNQVSSAVPGRRRVGR